MQSRGCEAGEPVFLCLTSPSAARVRRAVARGETFLGTAICSFALNRRRLRSCSTPAGVRAGMPTIICARAKRE
ncbi:hypothetical protein EVAR_54317_1 [Eumeta japonica]|uniref:Uncharacterized protein n=1 Tax=Eumeta variegata TaxID=151549 RepID=A0A4C1Z3T7_EUMVA|nr:hypothetical protein EVAR_54317_1 [Eumeta japonica]